MENNKVADATGVIKLSKCCAELPRSQKLRQITENWGQQIIYDILTKEFHINPNQIIQEDPK